MTFGALVSHPHRLLIQSRSSPISRTAVLFTVGLATVGVVNSIATQFKIASLPNMWSLVAAVVAVDVLSQLAPRTKIVAAVQTVIFGILYLVTTSLCGILAAYSMQRWAFPIQDRHLMSADMVLGFDWFAYAHWIDKHPAVQEVIRFAYNTIMAQIALPLVVLAFSNRVRDVRVYLLTFVIAFTITIFVSALMPAAGPITFVDRSTFDILKFTGATPIDHLTHLREAGPMILRDMPGGIATFPSFHATIAILTPLVLRSYPRIFIALLVLDAAMLGGTITEGAHYFSDVIAGAGVAFFAYFLAGRIVRFEDRAFDSCGDIADPVLAAQAS
jgi:membrane-associated phospholipid phosphatase